MNATLEANNTAVVITSAIHPAPDVFMLSITDKETRLVQTYACLLGWILHTSAKKIVICDNTVDPWVFSPFIALAVSNDIDLEVITYKSDQGMISAFGKGYGEGEILKHVMCNSRIIQDVDYFYKITGRQYVRNYDSIAVAHAGVPIVFCKNPRTGGVNTRFYKCPVGYYRKSLMNAYADVCDSRGVYIEHRFDEILKSTATISDFVVAPEIIGRCGTSGRVHGICDYSESDIIKSEHIVMANNALHRPPTSGASEI